MNLIRELEINRHEDMTDKEKKQRTDHGNRKGKHRDKDYRRLIHLGRETRQPQRQDRERPDRHGDMTDKTKRMIKHKRH